MIERPRYLGALERAIETNPGCKHAHLVVSQVNLVDPITANVAIANKHTSVRCEQ